MRNTCLVENVPHLRRSVMSLPRSQPCRAGLKFGSGPTGLQSVEALETQERDVTRRFESERQTLASPRISFGGVDVRNVADLHLRAMANPAARGERFLAVAGDVITLIDVAMILKKRLGPIARRVPTRELPDWLVRLLANFMPELRLIAPELGNIRNLTNAKARRVLHWTPGSNEDCIVATAESLQRLGLLRRTPRKPRRSVEKALMQFGPFISIIDCLDIYL
jgi:hypothetical protein